MQRSRPISADVYRVERLIDRRKIGNRVQYLVKWKGWSRVHNSWEPAKNILDKQLIKSFNSSYKRNKSNDESDLSFMQDSDTSITTVDNQLNTDTFNSPSHTITSPPSSPQSKSRTTISDSPLHSPTTGREVMSPRQQYSSIKMAGSSPTTVSPHSVPSEPFEYLSEYHFRPSTLRVAAATNSAVNTAAICRTANKQQTAVQHQPQVSTSNDLVNVNSGALTEERPKIRLTIPRDRILPPPTSSSSQSLNESYNSSQCTMISASTVLDDGDEDDETNVLNVSGERVRGAIHSVEPFLAPVEIPRRTPTATLSPSVVIPLRTSDIHVEHVLPSNRAPQSPKWDRKPILDPVSTYPTVPKVVLINSPSDTSHGNSKKRVSLELSQKLLDSIAPVPTSEVARKRKHSGRKEKRKRRRDRNELTSGQSGTESDVSVSIDRRFKIRRRSGSSNSGTSTHSSGDFSPTIAPTLSTTLMSNDETPRLAPLRIQINRGQTMFSTFQSTFASNAKNMSHNISGSRKLHRTSLKSSIPTHLRVADNSSSNVQYVPSNELLGSLLSPDARRLKLVQDICVTDVTVGGLTISIKECSGPKDFFGVKTSQLVQWDRPNVSIKPKMCEESPSVLIAPICTDENVAPHSITPSSSASVIRPMSSLPLADHQAPNLSTIIEESSNNTTTCSPRNVDSPRPVSPCKPEFIVEQTKNPSPDTTSGLEPITQPDSWSSMAVATEAVIKSASEPPSSPGLLTPPKRCSTPMEQLSCLPDSTENILTMAAPDCPGTLVVSSFPGPTCTTVTPILNISSTCSIANNPEVSSASAVYKSATAPITVSIFSQSRKRQQTAKVLSHKENSSSRKSKTKQRPPTASPRGAALPISLNRPRFKSSTSTNIDPVSIYTFPDSSPTHHLSPTLRSPNASSSSRSSCPKRFSQKHLKVTEPLPSTSTEAVASMLAMQQSSQVNEVLGFIPRPTSASMPFPDVQISNNLCTEPSLAVAAAVNALQLQFLYSDPNSTAAAVMAAAIAGLGPNGGEAAVPLTNPVRSLSSTVASSLNNDLSLLQHMHGRIPTPSNSTMTMNNYSTSFPASFSTLMSSMTPCCSASTVIPTSSCSVSLPLTSQFQLASMMSNVINTPTNPLPTVLDPSVMGMLPLSMNYTIPFNLPQDPSSNTYQDCPMDLSAKQR